MAQRPTASLAIRLGRTGSAWHSPCFLGGVTDEDFGKSVMVNHRSRLLNAGINRRTRMPLWFRGLCPLLPDVFDRRNRRIA